jgi:acetolactate synthase-1/2/3 large subunit
MVHHASQADMFLEGDVVATMRLLSDAVRALGVDDGAVKARLGKWKAAHDELQESNRAAEAEVSENRPIHPFALATALGQALPDDAFLVDETITLRLPLLRHMQDRGPLSYFRPAGGLGQGLGIGLGVKLAAPERPVVVVLGDGTFMYNPVIQSLALSKHRNLPIMIVIANNNGYAAMKNEHRAFYPDGVSASNDLFYGEPITDLDYADIANLFDGFGRRVDDPAELPGVLKEGLAALEGGKTAILNVSVGS